MVCFSAIRGDVTSFESEMLQESKLNVFCRRPLHSKNFTSSRFPRSHSTQDSCEQSLLLLHSNALYTRENPSSPSEHIHPLTRGLPIRFSKNGTHFCRYFTPLHPVLANPKFSDQNQNIETELHTLNLSRNSFRLTDGLAGWLTISVRGLFITVRFHRCGTSQKSIPFPGHDSDGRSCTLKSLQLYRRPSIRLCSLVRSFAVVHETNILEVFSHI